MIIFNLFNLLIVTIKSLRFFIFIIIKGGKNMKKKILAIIIIMLLITTLISFSAAAIKCEKRPATHIVNQNLPPDAPTVTIPEKVRQGGWLRIKTMTTDPDDDNVYYKFDIDGHDYGWVGPFQSGEEQLEKVILLVPIGSYTLGVQAKDTNEAKSDWTYTDFDVVKTKAITSPFLNFLESYPNFFPILRNLLGL